MTEDLEIAIKNGNIFRHKSCERCGAVDYEKLVKCMDRRAEFETHGFGIVNITTCGMNFEPKQLCLCDKCAEDFITKIIRFMEEKDQESISNTNMHKSVQAEWLINSDGYYPYCSHCKAEPQGHAMTDYCPNCGAQMKR